MIDLNTITISQPIFLDFLLACVAPSFLLGKKHWDNFSVKITWARTAGECIVIGLIWLTSSLHSNVSTTVAKNDAIYLHICFV